MMKWIVSWKFKGKTYSETFDEQNDAHRFAQECVQSGISCIEMECKAQ